MIFHTLGIPLLVSFIIYLFNKYMLNTSKTNRIGCRIGCGVKVDSKALV